eukprot:CAMPEP_0114540282 /NCGR_PEP_ID=MMETSP0114-20121206/679_1 /TAXON_ID=31324 /ORGANISM="Goniomonas sp, Strain m" /LENGTH=157 /DNA_ID=CAMNT_0001724423 /DNA_START=406 /DNA_END=880 /DNA_ORIENTATION=-
MAVATRVRTELLTVAKQTAGTPTGATPPGTVGGEGAGTGGHGTTRAPQAVDSVVRAAKHFPTNRTASHWRGDTWNALPEVRGTWTTIEPVVAVVAPATRYRRQTSCWVVELAGQAVQAADPAALLYVLDGHAVHGPPLGPVNPGAQTQVVLPVEVAV